MHKLKMMTAFGVTSALTLAALTAAATEENAVWGATYNSNQSVFVSLGLAQPGHTYEVYAWVEASNGSQESNQTVVAAYQPIPGNPIWGFNTTVDLNGCYDNVEFVSGGVSVTDLTNGDSVWNATLHSDGSMTYNEYAYFTPVNCGN